MVDSLISARSFGVQHTPTTYRKITSHQGTKCVKASSIKYLFLNSYLKIASTSSMFGSRGRGSLVSFGRSLQSLGDSSLEKLLETSWRITFWSSHTSMVVSYGTRREKIEKGLFQGFLALKLCKRILKIRFNL